jgi:hypothetical protein
MVMVGSWWLVKPCHPSRFSANLALFIAFTFFIFNRKGHNERKGGNAKKGGSLGPNKKP